MGGSSAKEIDENDEAEVRAFLKENPAKEESIKVIPKPIPVSWSSSSAKPKPQKVSQLDDGFHRNRGDF